jgi:urea transport system substrate-binding protein
MSDSSSPFGLIDGSDLGSGLALSLSGRSGRSRQRFRCTGDDLYGAPPADALRIALCMSTSGAAGLFGASGLACARLAVEQWNQDGGWRGRPVALHLIDASDESDHLEVDLANLSAEHGIDAIVGMHTSSVRERLTARLPGQIPYIYTPLYEGGPLAPQVLAIGETPTLQLLPALDWMIARWRLSRWFLVGNDYRWPRITHAMACKRLTERGCSVVGKAFVPLGQGDHEQLIDAIRASKAQAIVMSLVGQDAIAFGRALSDAGLAHRIPRLACGVEENGLLAMGSDCTDGLYVASGYFSGLDTDRNGAFRERYWSRFGERAPVLNAMGQSTYEGVAFLRAILSGDRDDDGAVRFESVRGIRWRSNDRMQAPIYLARAQGLGFEIIQTFARR